MTIAIINYGMGNLNSVQKVLNKIGYASIITKDPEEISEADLILLPGVGSFKKGMENLKESGLNEILTKEVIINKKPFIGICLGMQLVASFGTEPERVEGLGWIDGSVVKMESKQGYRIPHLGWNSVKINKSNSFYEEFDEADFYFIHSYHFKTTETDKVTMYVNYENDLVAAIEKENINVMQFHPEKSQDLGIKLLQKIINKYVKL